MNIAQLKLSQKKLLDNLVSRGYDIQYIKGKICFKTSF